MDKLLAFGDSVLKGVIYENEHYKVIDTAFYRKCAETLGIVIENKAKFGSTINKGEKIFERNLEAIRESTGEYVIMEFGGNDCDFNWKEISEDPYGDHKPMSSIRDFTSTYSYMIEQVKNMGKKPVLLSLPPIDSARYLKHISRGLSEDNIVKWMHNDRQYITNWHERYNIEVFKIAIENNIPVIDITTSFLEQKNYSDYLCDDGIHPNEKGHELIAEAIMQHVARKNIEFDRAI